MMQSLATKFYDQTQRNIFFYPSPHTILTFQNFLNALIAQFHFQKHLANNIKYKDETLASNKSKH